MHGPQLFLITSFALSALAAPLPNPISSNTARFPDESPVRRAPLEDYVRAVVERGLELQQREALSAEVSDEEGASEEKRFVRPTDDTLPSSARRDVEEAAGEAKRQTMVGDRIGVRDSSEEDASEEKRQTMVGDRIGVRDSSEEDAGEEKRQTMVGDRIGVRDSSEENAGEEKRQTMVGDRIGVRKEKRQVMVGDRIGVRDSSEENAGEEKRQTMVGDRIGV